MNNFINIIKELSYSNKYTKWYINICSSALTRGTNKKEILNNFLYIEKHHIVPDSFFINSKRNNNKGILKENSNNIENLVYLTAREHFIVHMLLPKMIINENLSHKISSAICKMMNKNKYYNSRAYETARKIYSKNHPNKLKEQKNLLSKLKSDYFKSKKGKEWLSSQKEKLSISMKGKNNSMYGKESGFKNKTHSKEHINKLKNKTGELHHNYKKKPKNIKKYYIISPTNEKFLLETNEILKLLNTYHKKFKQLLNKEINDINGYTLELYKDYSLPSYIITDLNNNEYKISNLKQFCKLHNLHYQCMIQILNNTKHQHKGWKIKKIIKD